jgi:hypothetical protein
VNPSIDSPYVPGAIVSTGKALQPGIAGKYNQLNL